MAEFRRASNEFRMQMEDELRIEEQKEHQKKVDAMAGPPSSLPEPEHPHLPSTTSESIGSEPDHGSEHDGTPAIDAVAEPAAAAATVPIAESGELKMMPPSTGLPVESGSYGTSARDNAPPTTNGNGFHEIPEHSILPESTIGSSSEEPAEEQTHA